MDHLTFNKLKPIELHDDISVFWHSFTEALDDYQEIIENFYLNYHRWLKVRTEVIESVNSLSDIIDKHDRNVNIASLSGSSVSLLSGGACLVGLALAPFTGGLSVLLTTGGLLGTSAGTLTAAGAHIAGFGLKKSICDKAHSLLETDCEETLCLAGLIDICLKHQSRILNLLENNNCIDWIQAGNSILSEMTTNATLVDRVSRIRVGQGSVEDFLVVLSVLLSDNSGLRGVNFLKSYNLKPNLIKNTLKIGVTLRSSFSNLRKCATIIKSWRNGLNAVSVASKMSRLAKGAMIGISMVADVVEIGSTAKDMISKKKSEESMTLRDIILEMGKQTEEVTEYYNAVTPAV